MDIWTKKNMKEAAMLIGREKETAALKNVMESGRSELVAVYGRRRIGKTFLIRETF